MGTNYYIKPTCVTCASPDHWIHIGKSSAGLRFMFHAYPRGVYTSHDQIPTWPVMDYESWLRLFDLGEIFDEYGCRVNKQYVRDMIDRKKDQAYSIMGHDHLDKDGHYFIHGEFS